MYFIFHYIHVLFLWRFRLEHELVDLTIALNCLLNIKTHFPGFNNFIECTAQNATDLLQDVYFIGLLQFVDKLAQICQFYCNRLVS